MITPTVYATVSIQHLLYRFFASFLDPFTLLILILALVLMILWYCRAASQRALLFLFIPLTLLYLSCMPLIAYLMTGLLEWSYPPIYKRPAETEAIVVLGSGVWPPNQLRKKAVLDAGGIVRCMKAAELYHAADPCLIVVTGGRVFPQNKGPVMGVLMRDLLLQLGVKSEDVIVESRSRSTYENAVFAGDYFREHDVDSVLVVSTATHLARAVRCFEKLGFRTWGAGCQYRATALRLSVSSFLPCLDAAIANHAVFHEWLGFVWYRINGRI